MVIDRIPNTEKQSKTLKEIETKFVEGVEKSNLKALSLDELAQRYQDIEQQSQMLQGQILLEARERFTSDKEFGQWCTTHSICVGSQQHRNRLINLARFFKGRELETIGISAAYEISAPKNADIAIEVYEYAKGKNLPFAEVKRQIAIRKGETVPLPIGETLEKVVEQSIVSVSSDTKSLMSKEQQVLDILKDLTNGEKLKILRDCTRIVNDEMRPK